MANVRTSGNLVSVYDLVTDVAGQTIPSRKWKKIKAMPTSKHILEASTVCLFSPRGRETPAIPKNAVAALLRVLQCPDADARARTLECAAVPTDATVIDILKKLLEDIVDIRARLDAFLASPRASPSVKPKIEDSEEESPCQEQMLGCSCSTC
jgi:hypothetical protein